jgi:uncharacterized protein (TIGR02597 family)
MRFIQLLLSLGFVAVGTNVTHATDIAATPPAGYFAFTASGNSDRHLSIPLTRRAAGIGHVLAVASANQISLSLAVAPADGAWASHPVTGTRYYIQFVTGALAGLTYPVENNVGAALTLNTSGDDLQAPAGAVVGDTVRVYPAWTVAEVCGTDLTNLIISPASAAPAGPYVAGDQILIPDNQSVGVNKLPRSVIAYVEGAGWRSLAHPGTDVSASPLLPGEGFVLRRSEQASLRWLILGYVPRQAARVRLPALADGEETELLLGVVRTEDVLLADAGLASVLDGPAAPHSPGDRLLTFDPAERGMEPAPSNVYNRSGTAWREGGAVVDQVNLKAGEALVLRLRGPRSVRYWSQPAGE